MPLHRWKEGAHVLSKLHHYSVIAIAFLACWKLSTLVDLNVLYIHRCMSSSAFPFVKHILGDFRVATQSSNKAFAILFCSWGNLFAVKWKDLFKVVLVAQCSELCFLISLIFINNVSVFTVFSSFMSFYG